MREDAGVSAMRRGPGRVDACRLQLQRRCSPFHLSFSSFVHPGGDSPFLWMTSRSCKQKLLPVSPPPT